MIQFVFNQKVSGSLAGTCFQFICKNFTLDADMPYASYTFNVIYNITCDGLNAFIEEKVINICGHGRVLLFTFYKLYTDNHDEYTFIGCNHLTNLITTILMSAVECKYELFEKFYRRVIDNELTKA